MKIHNSSNSEILVKITIDDENKNRLIRIRTHYSKQYTHYNFNLNVKREETKIKIRSRIENQESNKIECGEKLTNLPTKISSEQNNLTHN